ncbi:MAG: beta strand repeat-containing protein, partial [Prosthecobacter sp.]
MNTLYLPCMHSSGCPTVPARRTRRGLAAAFVAVVGIALLPSVHAQQSILGDWKVNASGSWSSAANWNNLDAGTSYPSGIDAIANLTNQISTTRTVTMDVPVTLGTLNIGDVSGGHTFNISGGTLTFDVTTGNAALNMVNDGGSISISSAIVLNDALDITLDDPTNNQGISLSGAISGGMGAGNVTMTINDISNDFRVNWVLINNASNSFTGQIVVESGLLRYETNNGSAGARGVGNETIATGSGSIDLRDRDFNVQADDTEIFRISGSGTEGLGALRNTSGTGSISHLILDGDATLGGYSSAGVYRHLDAAGTAEIAGIVDLGGHAFTKLGTAEWRFHNADIQGRAGAVINIHEGEVKIENDGALLGGALIDGTTYGNNLDGLTINVIYNKNPYDGVDPLNGTRTFDPYNPVADHTALTGNSIIDPRLSFGTYWTGANTHPLNVKVTDNFDNFTVNLSNGVWQREGSTGVGQTFDQIFGPNVTINFLSGGVGPDGVGSGNLFDFSGGSNGYNTVTGVFDHPGATEFQGVFDNTSPGNSATGFTVRSDRGEMRVTSDNTATFDGDILILRPTSRWITNTFTTSGTAPAASEYTNMSLAGANGSFAGASSITLSRWGSLALLNNSANEVYASVNNNNRLNDNGSLILRDGFLKIETDVSVTNTENLGHVIADGGTNYLYLDTRAGGLFDGSMQSFTSNANGVLKIYVTNPSQTLGTGAGENRVFVHDTSGINTVGSGAAGTSSAAVVRGIFGQVLPTLATPNISGSYTRSLASVQGSYMMAGAGMTLMTLDNGYLRPLTAAEFDTSASPVAGTNWLVNGYINPVSGVENYGNLDNYSGRNVTSDVAVNSLTISFDAAASGDAVATSAKDYIIIENGRTLKIDSGIININSYVEANAANLEFLIRGGRLDMNGQVAIINAAANWQDLDRNTANWYEVMTGNAAYIRTSITNATGFIKTGRNSLYLESANSITGNVWVGEQGSLVARHHQALGLGAPGREMIITGAGSFLLDYGTNISGINVRVTNSLQGSATVLRAEGTTHSTWGGDVILDVADEHGTSEGQGYTITARNNGTLTLYGNVYTANNDAISDSDSYADPTLVTTNIGETYTLNLRGQFRDLAGGNLANPIDGNPNITSIYRTGDSATRLDANHSLRFQMTGHDEGNVNVFQQWDATGRLDLRQGYFRVLYDPATAGGFYTDGARSLITANEYMTRVALGADGTSTTNAYHSHLMLTQDGQVFNSPYIYAYNDNRNGTLTIGGENESGTVYYGSNDNTVNFSLQFANQNSERDVRFLQVRGGTLVFNGRLDDENSTTTSFNSTVSIVGPGTVVFNRNAVGTSDIDRWNFMGGETHWGRMDGNNQFATTSTSSAAISVSGWGGGGLVLDAQSSARTQTLSGNIWMLRGSSYANTQNNTTLTLGSSIAALNRASGSSLAFLEDGNGAINITAGGLSTTAGDFLGAWGVYGSAAGGVTDWAARAGTTGVQAFSGYTDDTFGNGLHTNLTISPGALAADTSSATLRFAGAANVDLGGFGLTLEQGGILVPAGVGNVSITNGTLTSGWTAGSNDLMLHHFGSGTATIGAVITDNGGKVNLVNAGSGTTVLTGDNTYTGDTFLNGGVLEISSDANLGLVSGSIEKIVRVEIGSTNGASLTGQDLTFTTQNAPTTAAAGTYNTNSSQQVSGLTLTEGGSGYTSGVYVSTDVNNDGTVTGDGNGGIHAIMDSGNLHFDGGTLRVRDTMTLNGARTIFIGGNGAILMVDPDKVFTIDGYISSEFSHVTVDNGYNSSNHIGTDWQQASDRNPDIGDLIITGGGTVKLTGAPDGTVRGNMQNSYGGITWINDGILNIASAGSTADGILGTNRSWIDGTIIGPQGTLLFSTTSDVSFREWTTFRGQGYQGRGTIQTLGTARIYRLTGQLYLEEDLVFNSKNASTIRVNEGGGTMYGSADIYKSGNSTLAFYGNAPEWTGRLFNSGDALYVLSAGNLGGMTGLTLTRNSIFYNNVANTSVNEFRDRLPDNLPIFTDGYVRMRMDATGGVYSGVEKVGTLNVMGGQLGLEFNLGADLVGGNPRLQGDHAVWHFDEIVRGTGSTVHLRSLDAGTEFAGADFLTTQFQNVAGVRVNTLPSMVGAGDGSNGNAAVVQGFFGGVRPAWVNLAGTGNIYNEDYTSTRLVTAVTTPGGEHYLRPLLDSEYFTLAHDDTAQITSLDLSTTGVTADQNLRIVGVTTDTGIGSGELGNRRDSLITLGALNTLAVNSLTFESSTFVGTSTSGWGNFTAISLKANDTIVIGSGMVVYANTGIQNRLGASHNTGINMDIRSSVNAGRLDFNAQDATFNIAGRWVHYNTSDALGAYRETDGDNALLYLNSSITNAINFIKTGGGAIFVQSANSYTGNTYIDQGTLYARNDQALGTGTHVYVNGAGGFVMSHGANITDKTLVVGAISGNNIALVLQEGASWGGDIVLDNIDAAGSTSYSRNFTTRIYQDQSYRSAIHGDIYGGPTAIGASGLTDSRMFSTYDTSNGILDLRGMVRDTASGAVSGPITSANQNQVLRMELVSNNSENTVQLWNSYDAAGRIRLLQANLVYQGTGNFYSDAAAAAIESAIGNAMVGFQMGGRSVMTSDGSANDDLAFFLANSGSIFNLSSWEVGVETTDPDNQTGADNFNRGNITGNSTLGGLNTSGSVTFGTGAGAIVFTNMTRFAAYDRDLRLSAALGGTVNIDAALVDGGSGVNSSITKIGGGTVNLNGSSIGAGSVEGVNVLGGMLVLTNYDANLNRRVASGASLLMGGGILVMDGGAAFFTENFGGLTLRSGGSALAATGNGTLSMGGAAITRSAGGTLHFQSVSGGTLNFSNAAMASLSRIGSYATFGASTSASALASDWAATDALGNVVAFTGYGVDSFGAAIHTDVQSVLDLSAGTTTASVRFNAAAGSIGATGAQTLTLTDGGILISSQYTGSTPFSSDVALTTASTGTDLIIHNYASGMVALNGSIIGGQNVVFSGVGALTLGGTNTYSGATFVNGQASVAFDNITRFGSTTAFHLNGGTLNYDASAPASSSIVTQGIVLGGGSGIIQVTDADSTLILRGASAIQITGEANPVSTITTGNPFSGGLSIIGSGSVQFGNRSADSATTDVLGLTNDYTGLTIIGDGVNAIRVDIQGQGADNAQYTPFGTTYSWADGTILRNNATLELSARRGDGSRDAQYRLREWFQIGEQAGDEVTISMTTYRQAVLDGQINIIGNLTIHSQNAGYADSGNTTNHTDLLFNPNEGGVYGTGNIIKTGDGNVRFYQGLRDWTGDLEIWDGFVGIQSYQTSMFEPTGKIYLGDPTTDATSLVRLRIEGRFGNSATSLDSGFQNIEISRDIITRDNIRQEVRLELGYSAETYLSFTGNVHVGSGSSYATDNNLRQFRIYNEDTTGLDASVVGHAQHSVIDFKGNITGSNNIMIFANEGGSVNETSEESDITLTVLLSGDNSGFTGQWTLGEDVSATLDMDDAQILRLGNVNGLLDNQVNFRNRGTLQLGGINKTFTQNFLFIGGPGTYNSAAIENASGTATTITFDSGSKAGVTFQDVGVGLRDGVAQPIFGGGSAALGVVKIGIGETVFGAATGGGDTPGSFSSYTGNTLVQQGTLISGSNNAFSPNSRFVISDGAMLSLYWENAGVGFDNLIGSVTGSSAAIINIDNSSILRLGGDNTRDADFAGTIIGYGDVFMTGGGAQTLSGDNEFIGNVGIIQGTLIGASNTAFGDVFNLINLGGVT